MNQDWYNNNWIVGVGTGAIVMFLGWTATLVYDRLLKWNSKHVQESIVEPPSVEKVQEPSDLKKQERLAYTTDRIKGMVWKWHWQVNTFTMNVEIKNLRAICKTKTCIDQQMYYWKNYSDVQRIYKCPNCNRNTIIIERKGEIEDIIQRRAHKILNS